MRFTNAGTNPDFFLWVFDLNTAVQTAIVDGSRLNRGDDNGISVRLTADGRGNCRARWRVRTDDGRENEGTASESASEPGGTTVEVSL